MFFEHKDLSNRSDGGGDALLNDSKIYFNPPFLNDNYNVRTGELTDPIYRKALKLIMFFSSEATL